MPNSPRTAHRLAAARYYANQAAAFRRARAARLIQARVRGMLTRLHLANPAWGIRTYANAVTGKGLGYRAVKRRVFNRPNNMRAYGARIRAGIRHGPEHYVAPRSTALWRANARASGMSAAARASMRGVNGPRGAVTRRTPSPNRNNNNLYA